MSLSCPFCKKVFYERDLAIKHMKSEHSEEINKRLSQLPPWRIKNLKKRGVNPKNWIAGYILTYSQPSRES
jgi:uncharacterized C2H2 Zn-finger protein